MPKTSPHDLAIGRNELSDADGGAMRYPPVGEELTQRRNGAT
jgi:hypothetical protein